MTGNTIQPEVLSNHWMDFLELTKPKVVLLILLTSLVGMFLASTGSVPWDILIFGNLGIALCAGSAATINHIVDRKIDILMIRTHKRPIVQGKIEPEQALIYAFVLGFLGTTILFIIINPLTAILTLASLFGYAIVYTSFLKRTTPQNIVIGGLAGATPPLLGWTAVSGQIDSFALLPVLIIFTWTPPHFWSLAIHKKKEYSKANIPMLPVTHGENYTKLHILLYTLLLTISTIIPFIVGMSGPIYLFSAIILNSGFIYWAFVLLKGQNTRAAINTFRYSIIYLLLLFLSLLVDHYIYLP